MVSSRDIVCDVDFGAPGRTHGSYFVAHSDNAHPFGFRGPVGVLNGAPGPTLTLIGGVHGDEYQGPIVAARLFHELDPAALKGRLIVLPALNAPAVAAATRCSPLDGGNLNRAFRPEPARTPTGAIAAWLEAAILPLSDAVIDIHAGGRASVFAPVAMINPFPEPVAAANRALAEAFDLPLIWEMGPLNSDASVNAAAARAGVPMMACELGGAGGSDARTNALAHRGVLSVMAHLGMIDQAPSRTPGRVYADLPDHRRKVRAPRAGLFDPMKEPGEDVAAGDLLGVIRDVEDLGAAPAEVRAQHDGVLAMRVWRGAVAFGEQVGIVLRKRPGPTESA